MLLTLLKAKLPRHGNRSQFKSHGSITIDKGFGR